MVYQWPYWKKDSSKKILAAQGSEITDLNWIFKYFKFNESVITDEKNSFNLFKLICIQ